MIINARIHTNSPEFKIVKDENNWTIYVRSKPQDNKANTEIIKELTKKYKTCRILKGAKSRKKTIEILL